MTSRALAPLLAAWLAAGCTVGSDYVRPDAPVPETYREMAGWKQAAPSDAIARGPWWEVFGDPELDALAQRVDVSNQNIKSAEARYRQAQAFVRQVRAGLFPVVGASGSASRGTSPGRDAPVASNYQLALAASWEPDLWGRVRRSVESAEASRQASVADLESARLSAQAALVQAYFALRITDVQRQVLEDTAAAYARTLELTRNRYAAGTAARVDVVQAEVQLKSTQARLVDLGVSRAQLEHVIATLVGKPPADLSIARAPLAARIPAIPAGVPSELLERRPDIASAERSVAAANAQIGVAQAAYYPSLTLSATAGFLSPALADWLSAPARYWSLGAALAETLFDGGVRAAVSDQAVAAYDAEVALYRQTVLAGFQEVEDNLAALRVLEEEAALQDEALQGARKAVDLTTNQYKAGIVSFLNVIAAQAIALNNEATAVSIQGQRLLASVALVKALGGGWSAKELEQDSLSRDGPVQNEGTSD
ncbi:MAG: efflux transporter outer membrane subunit [Burkholderiales bacterium]|nr:efflux transporter outer membrane subunit [Burkholderiales bacterium]